MHKHTLALCVQFQKSTEKLILFPEARLRMRIAFPLGTCTRHGAAMLHHLW